MPEVVVLIPGQVIPKISKLKYAVSLLGKRHYEGRRNTGELGVITMSLGTLITAQSPKRPYFVLNQ